MHIDGHFIALKRMYVYVVTFLIQPTNSPRIGPHKLVFLQVPAAATSGFIAFASGSLQVTLIIGM